MSSTDKEVIDKAARMDGLMTVAPLIAASMKESQRITERLEATNVKSCFLDGFAAGLEEGANREAARIRRALGIREEKTYFLEGEFYLKQMKGYPYRSKDDA